MTPRARPIDNPFNVQRVDALRYVEFDHSLQDVANQLQQHRYRGAISGPHGCGKSATLQALGDQLMQHGFTPLPLFMNTDQQGQLPADWRRAIRCARHTDALLLDGYDLLPIWARLWVLFVSRRAGALIVTTHREGYLQTIAKPRTSPALLRQLIDQLAPSASDQIDADQLYGETQGNLRDALRMAYDLYPEL